MSVPEPHIITCSEWGARSARAPIVFVGSPDETIFHHTAGVGGADKIAYVRQIQNYHMDHNGWNDTGQNFTICTDGKIYEGRHGSLAAVRSGRMVASAHCVGHNNSPGVEHEEITGPLTGTQFKSSVALHAWLSDRGTIPVENLYRPHRQFNPTACPGDLMAQIPALRAAVNALLDTHSTVTWPLPIPAWFWTWAKWRLGRGPFVGQGGNPNVRPADAPLPIPQWAWDRLALFTV